ncbi:MAG: hypothetical protein ACP5H0_08060, partial [Caldisericum sp.]|uniref:hypothetical protein n=1 Tax=Caldisericum sp. TaxID=2499687 RepID=UPI003D13FBBB
IGFRMTNESEKLFFLFLGESWKGDVPSSNYCHFEGAKATEKSPPFGVVRRGTFTPSSNKKSPPFREVQKEMCHLPMIVILKEVIHDK